MGTVNKERKWVHNTKGPQHHLGNCMGGQALHDHGRAILKLLTVYTEFSRQPHHFSDFLVRLNTLVKRPISAFKIDILQKSCMTKKQLQ